MNQRLVNCDFFTKSDFIPKISNKAKLLYFLFLVNADDKGFVGNGTSIAETLDQCEENFDNVLFHFKYVDALKELVDKRLCFEFVDKVGNKTYLIRHWFLHNKWQKFLTTNYISYLSKVELVDNKYEMKNPYKGKEINKTNKLNEINDITSSSHKEDSNEDNSWEKEWDKFIKESENIGEK